MYSYETVWDYLFGLTWKAKSKIWKMVIRTNMCINIFNLAEGRSDIGIDSAKYNFSSLVVVQFKICSFPFVIHAYTYHMRTLKELYPQ